MTQIEQECATAITALRTELDEAIRLIRLELKRHDEFVEGASANVRA